MKKIVILATLGVATSLTSACASVTRGAMTAWEVTSTPPGARVETSNGFHCQTTPRSIKMPRKSEFIATLTLEGYRAATVTVTNKVPTGAASPWLGMSF